MIHRSSSFGNSCWSLLRYAKKNVQKHLFYTVAAVMDVIINRLKWKTNLNCTVFSDTSIAEAIKQSDVLLGAEIAGDFHA